jgi:hypothetical protein
VPRRILFVVVGLSVVVAVGVGLWLSSSRPVREPSAGPVAKAEPPPKAAPPRPVAEPEPEPKPAPARRPAPKPKAEPPPAPVEAEPAAPTTGTLHVQADVAGASVFLDQAYVGTAPATIPDVPPGPHRLNVSAEGHEGYAETVDVQPGERTIVVRFTEIRLDAAIDVVHKHGIGSCRGRLVATPEGMRYETDNKNDRFNVPLLRLEIFEVDYLQKNLRVKVKGGKNYNFTDPEENADRLFVFHRDVQKVRDRLASAGR